MVIINGCPCCDSQPTVCADAYDGIFILCTECGLQTPPKANFEDALAVWNKGGKRE